MSAPLPPTENKVKVRDRRRSDVAPIFDEDVLQHAERVSFVHLLPQRIKKIVSIRVRVRVHAACGSINAARWKA